MKILKKYPRTVRYIIVILLVILVVLVVRYLLTYEKPTYNNVNSGPVQVTTKVYGVNEYNVISVDEVNVYTSYYKNFINLIVNDPKSAYDLLTDDCKRDRYKNDYNNFYEKVSKLDKNELLNYTIDRYSKTDDRIIIVDSNEYSFSFYEDGVNNYTVYINGKVMG